MNGFESCLTLTGSSRDSNSSANVSIKGIRRYFCSFTPIPGSGDFVMVNIIQEHHIMGFCKIFAPRVHLQVVQIATYVHLGERGLTLICTTTM